MTDRSVLTGEHFMLGDHAVTEGALAAGCRFFGGYPITPASEVAERMSWRMAQVGGEYIQMEDELASMAAIVGASCAGAKSMTATSGPGFSLMMENIGLAYMMEVPCVILDVMRGGPSTGMPTLTSQGDMMQVKWGSHGDYQVIAYCPSSVQEMFDLTIKAFNAAEKYRLPTFIMGDQILGHMTAKVQIPPPDGIEIVNRKITDSDPKDYLPYDSSELVPPMAHAGDGYRIHMTGLTHDERGYPATYPEAHKKLMDRLNAKLEENLGEIIEIEERLLEDAEVAVIAYGSEARSAWRAVQLAREEGIKVGLMRLITAWPFPGDQIQALGRKVRKIIMPEVNYGQLVHMARGHTRCEIVSLPHPGGAIHRPDEILSVIREAMK
jgi:2-oxoglutarate/2-oxoacid ferredoxin oxidoreductase subunit alpha